MRTFKVTALVAALALAALSHVQAAPISMADAAQEGISMATSKVVAPGGSIDVMHLPMIAQGYQSLNTPAPGFKGLNQQVGRVPEPATLSLLGLGLAGLGIGRGRKRK